MTVSAGTRTTVPYFETSETKHRRAIARWASEVHQGHIQCVGDLTLTANATSSTVVDSRAGVHTFIEFMPKTANAAVEKAAGTMWVSTQAAGSFVVTHANNAQTDRTYIYALLG